MTPGQWGSRSLPPWSAPTVWLRHSERREIRTCPTGKNWTGVGGIGSLPLCQGDEPPGAHSQFTRARVIWAERPGPVVPVLAVQSQNGQSFAWVAKRAPDGSLTAEQRVVQVGPIQGQLYPVIKGVAVGDMIISSGVQKLRPGARVTQLTDAGQPGR